jgi:pimeloyl-ACP methyl ester carboxylesterase
VDQRNHGQSFHSDDFNYDLLSDDLHKLVVSLKLEKFILLGHSMGGKVAMKFASMFPEKLLKLIVVDIAPKFYKRHHDDILNGLNSLELDKLESRQQADQALSKYIPEIGVRQFLLKNLYRKESNEFDWRINLKVLTDKIDNIGEQLDEKVSINVPTLFIRGGKSRYIKDEDEKLISKLFTNYKIIAIPNAGHWVQAEKPQEFLEVVNSFIQR